MKVNVGGAAGNDINFVAVNFLLKSSPERLHVSRVKQMELFTVFQVKKNTDSDVPRFTHKLDRKRIHGCFTCKTRLMAEKVDLFPGKLLWKIA